MRSPEAFELADSDFACRTLTFERKREFGLGLAPVESFQASCEHGFYGRLDVTQRELISSSLDGVRATVRLIIKNLIECAMAWHGPPPLTELTDWGWFDAEASA